MRTFKQFIFIFILVDFLILNYIFKVLQFDTLRTINNFIAPDHKYPQDMSCKCQSLFTLGSCRKPKHFIESIPKMNEVVWRTIMKSLEEFRNGGSVLMDEVLLHLARYVPQSFVLKLPFKNEASELKRKLYEKVVTSNETKLPIKTKIVLTHTGFPSCSVHQYSPLDVVRCANLFQDDHNRPLRIYFVGDSMIRSIMEEMVQETHKHLNFTFINGSQITLNVEEHFLDQKLKMNIPLRGNGLELRLYWAPNLEANETSLNSKMEGAKTLLENLVYGTAQELYKNPLPDILYIGGGIWDAIGESPLDATEGTINRMNSLLSLLERLSKKVQILWHFHPLLKKWMKKPVIHEGSLQLSNQVHWLYLKKLRIWIWDSLGPLSTREMFDCRRLQELGVLESLPSEWKCLDKVHPGKFVRKSGANMLWNLACNKILNLKDKCCS